MNRFAISIFCTVLILGISHTRLAAQGPLPQCDTVEKQPLLLLTNRLAEALESIGSPLSKSDLQKLAQLNEHKQDLDVTREVQRILDPRCAMAVEILADGTVKPTKAMAELQLEENGWRTFLIKIVNRAGVASKFRIESPNARPIPHGPADDIENRWMALSLFEGRPMLPNLSGLGLEYRIVQVYASQTGQRQAKFEFNVGGLPGRTSSLIKQWRFDKDTDGWEEPNDCRISVSKGALHIEQTGDDPFLSAPVTARGGRMRLKWWGRAEEDGVAQVFWWTRELPQPDGGRLLNVQVFRDREQQYEIEIPVEGELAGVRIDPNVGPGKTRIDWIDLEYATGEGVDWTALEVPCTILPAHEVRFVVNDSDGSPCMASFEIRDSVGRVYPSQPKRQAPDMFFQTQIYRETGESIRLPSGTYSVRCNHGPESVPETFPLVVKDAPVTFEYQVKRWIDTAKHGYWSGDHHIHAAGCLHYENPVQGILPKDMLRHIMGEDVKVGCCLTWGPCFDFQKQFFTGRTDDVSRYPYLLRYDIEVSGFGSHVSGHLNLLKLKQQIPPGGESKAHWPTLGLNTLRWAKAQGAVTGTAHSGSGLTSFVGRTNGTDGPHGLPNYNIPAYDGIGANEFIMQITHEAEGPDGKLVPALDFIATMNTPRVSEWNMWYHALNCGFPVVASGETDFPCMSGERVGIGRVYVKQDGRLDYDQWVAALRDGKSYVSDGTCHLMDFRREANGTFRVDVASRQLDQKEQQVELIVNGLPVETKTITPNGDLNDLTFAAPNIPQSSWVAVRVFPNAHSNPIRVLVNDKPIRASKLSAEWCLAGVEQCWLTKKHTYRADEIEEAKEAYEHARLIYKKIIEECHE